MSSEDDAAGWPGIGVQKVAALIPVSRGFLSDLGLLPPWEEPDRNRWPAFVLFPRLDRAQRAATEARHRVLAAFDVLRYGAPEKEWD